MDWNTYQAQAATTAVYPISAKLQYPVFGLCGEAGEVMERLKRSLRSGKPIDRDGLIDELGDVLWYISAICTDIGITLSAVVMPSGSDFTLVAAAIRLYKTAGDIASGYLRGRLIHPYLPKAVQMLSCIAHHLDFSMQDVMVRNLAKLKDRQERNKLQGEGGDR